MKDKIFISYDYDNDKHYKNLLLAWDKNDLFDFNFYDQSVDVSINSTSASYIKTVIKGKIINSDYFICLIGDETHKSDWVDWEIRTASDLKKRIIGVKINNSNYSPDAMYGRNASWAKSFKRVSMVSEI